MRVYPCICIYARIYVYVHINTYKHVPLLVMRNCVPVIPYPSLPVLFCHTLWFLLMYYGPFWFIGFVNAS